MKIHEHDSQISERFFTFNSCFISHRVVYKNNTENVKNIVFYKLKKAEKVYKITVQMAQRLQ